MKKGKEERLFNDELKKVAKRALKENAMTDKHGSKDIYYHPTEKGIVRKCIDLKCKHPLHDLDKNKCSSITSHPWPERWLEAYLIQRAKGNKWILEIADHRHKHKYRFLYSQLKFKSFDKGAQPLDLLLYEQDTGFLVVMELKINRALTKAKQELRYYCTRLSDNTLQNDLREIFDLGKKIRGVKGYIVWPEKIKNDANDKNKYAPFGFFEYQQRIKSEALSNKLKVEFTYCKEAGEWTG